MEKVRLLIAVILSCMSITGYSQSNHILEYVEYMEKRLQIDRSTIADDYYDRRQSEVLEKRLWATNVDKIELDKLLKVIQDSIDSHSNYLRAKSRAELGIIEEEQSIIENKVFDLMPKNMLNYLGKVNRIQFEELVGEPVGDEDSFIVYEVESVYEEMPIAIRCHYHEETDKLIHVHFPTPSHLGYELAFIHLPEYKKTGNHKVYKNQFNQTYRINYKYKGFGMQVFYDGVISYHTVK